MEPQGDIRLVLGECITEQGKHYEDQLADGYGVLAGILESLPQSRSASLALTKLDECLMWANQAILGMEGEGSGETPDRPETP